MASSTPISFRSTPLGNRLSTKSESLGGQTIIELNRFFALLDSALVTINLDYKECALICDALNGTLFEGYAFLPNRAIAFNVQDSIAYNNLDQKWNVDGDELLVKLKNHSPLQGAAIVDAVERFWHQSDRETTMEESVTEIFKISKTHA